MCTGWHRINWTIQPFNRVYENLHKITPLTLVAHRQIRRQKEICRALQQVVYHHRRIGNSEQIGQDVIDHATGQFRK